MEGIDNLGGTCAINSLLQIIIRNDKLRSVILNLNPPENSFTSELKEVIDDICDFRSWVEDFRVVGRTTRYAQMYFKVFSLVP